jgi:hypothetical protein
MMEFTIYDYFTLIADPQDSTRTENFDPTTQTTPTHTARFRF